MAQILFEDTPELAMELKVSRGTMAAMHYHHAYEIYYLLRGERDYFIGDKFYKVGEGDLVFIPHPLLHRTAGKAGSRFLIYFTDAFLSRFFSKEITDSLTLREPFVFRPTEETGKELGEVFRSFYTQYLKYTEEEACNAPLLAGYLFRILFTVTHAPNGYLADACSDGRIGEIVRYINEHYSSISGIEELAERFFISKYHFCRSFSKHLGIPPMTYLNTIKIRAACELLKNSTLNHTEIATRCGFNSPSYFCKVFKSEKGVSPSAYRKRLR